MKNLIAPFLVIVLTLLIVYSIKDCTPNAKKSLSGRYGLRDTVFVYTEPVKDTVIIEIEKWKTKYITKQEWNFDNVWAPQEYFVDSTLTDVLVYSDSIDFVSDTFDQIHVLVPMKQDTSVKPVYTYAVHSGGDTTLRYEFHWDAVTRSDGEIMTLVPTINVFPDTVVVQKRSWLWKLFNKNKQ